MRDTITRKTMKVLLDLICQNCEEDTPIIVRQAMSRLRDCFNNPPVPIMSDEDYEKLSPLRKNILTCNMPGCNKVVCTHGMVCVDHHKEIAHERNYHA